MFALRRVAARAVFTQQPVRQLSTVRPAQSRFSQPQSAKPALCRSFHQSLRWCAEEEQKQAAGKAEASPAEAETTGETVTTEPSAAEQKEITEESITSPEVLESAKETASNAAETVQQRVEETSSQAQDAASGATEQVQEKVQKGSSQARGVASSAAGKVQDIASSTAQTVQSAASSVAGAARQAFPSQGSQDSRPTKIIYVGNLFFEVTAPQLEAEFGRYGEIVNSRVVTDSRGLSKGFGYIEFASQESADRAIVELDQKVFQGRRLAVQYHVRRERESRSSGQRAREPNQPSKTLFIGNMSYQMSDRDLNDLFREIRNVLDVRVAIDRRSGQPRGFAHADFIDIPSAQRAKEHLEQKVVYGRQLRVDYSQSSSQTSQIS